MQLDFDSVLLERLREVLTYPHGMVLVTGPTGSGKSTTLYAALRETDRKEFNVLTVEDPIEQQLEDATQVQIGVKINFSQALRSFLRHDPDIILVGEIRDHDTAETAIKASMTGHLVLSTLHTNNATSAVSRLRNLGCEDFMIASTLRLVIAQRLVRRLCPICRQPTPVPKAYSLMIEAEHIYTAKGCVACMGTGYKGRIGLHEMFWVNEALSQMIAEGIDEHQLRTAAAGEQLYTLWQDALFKVASGKTSLEEVLAYYDRTITNEHTDESFDADERGF
jgi:type IV pilus assembly protein PilB